MQEITVTVRDKTAAACGDPVIVCGNSDCTVTFDLDSDWDGFPLKTARFVWLSGGALLHQDVLFEGNVCAVPVLRDTYEVSVGLYAGSICTSSPARIPCARCITDGCVPRPDPAPDVYEQLLAYLEAMQQDSAPPPASAGFCAAGFCTGTVGSAESEEA